MKIDDFLIITSVGDVSRRAAWQGEGEHQVDHPKGWIIEKVGEGLRLRDNSRPPEEAYDNAVFFDTPEFGESRAFELPPPHKTEYPRPVAVEIVRMKPLKPVYVIGNTLAPAYPAAVAKQLMMFYGQRFFLVRFRPVSASMSVELGNLAAYQYGKSPTGYWVTANIPGMRIKFMGKNQALPPNSRFELTEQQFFSATVIVGIHWWRFRMTPTPDSLPPIESDENEDRHRETARLKQSVSVFSVFFAGLMLVLFAFSMAQKPPKVLVATNVSLKTPKIIPPSPTAPTPAPTPVATPMPVAEKKPEPPPKPEPKPKPEKKVAKKEPKPKKVVEKVAKAPTKPPPKSPEPPPKPQKVVEKQPPAPPAPNPAAEHAKEVQAQQQQLAAKLNFLSTSSKRVAVDPTAYEVKEGKFGNTPTVGGLSSKTNSLDKVVKGASGDGQIRTGSSRTVASTVDFGPKAGKGLNDVQGKVSAGELASGGSGLGNAFAGGGLSVSGNISQSEIEKALAKYLTRFRFCYEKSLLTNASLGGNVVFQWTIAEDGKTLNPKVVSSQLNNEELHGCMKALFNEIKFPKPKGGTATVKKTFSFSSSAL
jgi:outer membrane biosynthesis protein TonB